MTIQEAISSGKKYRRKGEEYWINRSVTGFPIADILADDWEIEREQREVFLVLDQQTNRLIERNFLTLEDAKMYYHEETFKAIKFREVIE